MPVKKTTNTKNPSSSFFNTCISCIREGTKPITAVVLFFSISFALLSIAFGVFMYTWNQAYPQGTIAVNGESIVSVIPNAFEVDFEVVSSAEEKKETVANVARTVSTIKTVLLELGIEKENIETQDYTVRRQYRTVRRIDDDDEGRVSVPDGYKTVHRMRVVYKDMETIDSGEVINVLVENGAINISNARFFIDKEKMSDLKRQAISISLEDARKNTILITRRLGVSVVAIETFTSYINEDNKYSIVRGAILENIVSVPTPNLSEGKSDIHARVDMTLVVR